MRTYVAHAAPSDFTFIYIRTLTLARARALTFILSTNSMNYMLKITSSLWPNHKLLSCCRRTYMIPEKRELYIFGQKFPSVMSRFVWLWCFPKLFCFISARSFSVGLLSMTCFRSYVLVVSEIPPPLIKAHNIAGMANLVRFFWLCTSGEFARIENTNAEKTETEALKSISKTSLVL